MPLMVAVPQKGSDPEDKNVRLEIFDAELISRISPAEHGCTITIGLGRDSEKIETAFDERELMGSISSASKAMASAMEGSSLLVPRGVAHA